jgi:hypothetical protein
MPFPIVPFSLIAGLFLGVDNGFALAYGGLRSLRLV